MGIDMQKAKNDFDEFLALMDGQVAWLESEADQAGLTLGFSRDTPEQLEALLESLNEDLDGKDSLSLIIIVGRYLGEFLRRTYAGRWVLSLDEKNVNFNRPVIVGCSSVQGLEFYPVSFMRGYALRGKSGDIRRAIECDVNFKNFIL